MGREELLRRFISIRKKLDELEKARKQYLEAQKEWKEALSQEEIIREKQNDTIITKIEHGIFYVLIVIAIFCFSEDILFGIVSLVFCFILLFVSFLILEIIEKYVKQEEKMRQIQNIKADKFHQEHVVPLEEIVCRYKKNYRDIEKSDEIQLFRNWLPKEYRSLKAIDFFIKTLKSRKADTEKELYNSYDEFLYKKNLLATQKKQLKTQEEQLEVLKQQIDKENS